MISHTTFNAVDTQKFLSRGPLELRRSVHPTRRTPTKRSFFGAAPVLRKYFAYAAEKTEVCYRKDKKVPWLALLILNSQ